MILTLSKMVEITIIILTIYLSISFEREKTNRLQKQTNNYASSKDNQRSERDSSRMVKAGTLRRTRAYYGISARRSSESHRELGDPES